MLRLLKMDSTRFRKAFRYPSDADDSDSGPEGMDEEGQPAPLVAQGPELMSAQNKSV